MWFTSPGGYRSFYTGMRFHAQQGYMNTQWIPAQAIVRAS